MTGAAFEGPLLAGLVVFAQVVQSGSFTRAAGRLSLSPSGVSRAVNRLERRLGVRLLSRTTRALTLTDDGRSLYDGARLHLEAVAEAAARAAGSVDAVRGTLRVNIDSVFNRCVLVPRLPEFLEQHPELQLELLMQDSAGKLIADRFDLAIRFGPPPHRQLIARRLAEARVLTVAAPAYLSRHGRPSTPHEVAAHRMLLLLDPATDRPHEWEFRRRRETVQIAARGPLMLSDATGMLEACVQGAGIAQILDWAAGDLFERGALVNLFPDWDGERYPLYAIYPSRHYVAAKVRAFIQFCESCLQRRTGLSQALPAGARGRGRLR